MREKYEKKTDKTQKQQQPIGQKGSKVKKQSEKTTGGASLEHKWGRKLRAKASSVYVGTFWGHDQDYQDSPHICGERGRSPSCKASHLAKCSILFFGHSS